ncbi:unnamed protein product [Ceratitis capitata]|uniref:(Mediterranean fruit fly) hypothetical protein n=1 Tax=Ceratitis capitata TaxID=7213 RepID=A0A811UV75_CERCA|nr:unnamed protein product [Ceratitis capitata]
MEATSRTMVGVVHGMERCFEKRVVVELFEKCTGDSGQKTKEAATKIISKRSVATKLRAGGQVQGLFSALDKGNAIGLKLMQK